MNDYRELHELYHHGIKGQEWGVRRFQNEDGTRTEAGKKRYGDTHIHFDPVSWIAGIASKKSGERLTSIKVAGDKNNGDSLFIDSLLFIPFNIAKQSINNRKERQKLLEEGILRSVDTSNKIYKPIEKEKNAMYEAWNKYTKEKSEENYNDYLKKNEDFMNKAYAINKEYMSKKHGRTYGR